MSEHETDAANAEDAGAGRPDSEGALDAAEGALGAAEGALGATEGALGAAKNALGAVEGALGAAEGALSAAQRARSERSRQRARALRDARLVLRPKTNEESRGASAAGPRIVDTGGGFLLEDEGEAPPPRLVAPPAPFVHPAEQPHCLECERPFPQSYLFDSFDYGVCDACRDDGGAHALITRTEAKGEFLLQDCDLDGRQPPLRCVRRPNPHRARFAEMRLYLRAQVEARALQVWGSAAALEEERAARRRRRERGAQSAARRRLRELRMDVRSSLFRREAAPHEHAFGPGRPLGDDEFERRCATCGHVEVYGEM